MLESQALMEEVYDETYHRIKAAAVRLFAEQGYVATGIRDIAKAAGFSSAALYHQVSGKEELLVDIMREGFERLIASARAVLAGKRSPEAKLAALVRQHVLAEMSDRQLNSVVTVEFRFLGPAARAQVLPLRDAYETIWNDVIEQGVTEKVFEVDNVRLARLALLEMCASPGAWYADDGHLTRDEIAAAFVEMGLGLVRAKAPRGGRASGAA